MLEKILRVICLCFSVVYAIVDIIVNCYLRFQSMIMWSYDLYQCRGSSIGHEIKFLDECKSYLTKIPKHLSIIVGPENRQVNEKLLTKIFMYASKLDVDCISYFDTRLPDKGYINLKDLKSTKDVKLNMLKENYYQWSYSSSENMKTKPTSNGVCKMNGMNGYAAMNGMNSKNNNGKAWSHYDHEDLPKRFLKIYQLNFEDSRPLMAKMCRNFFRNRSLMKHLLTNREALSEEITKYLASQVYECNDPDLCIVFSNSLCTFGLLPWQTKFTEFYLHSPIYEFNAMAFAKILNAFSKCEQRWGK